MAFVMHLRVGLAFTGNSTQITTCHMPHTATYGTRMYIARLICLLIAAGNINFLHFTVTIMWDNLSCLNLFEIVAHLLSLGAARCEEIE